MQKPGEMQPGVSRSGSRAPRCVLLTHAHEAPAALREGLERRGIEVAVVHQPVHAMLELAVHEADALIVDQPDQLTGADELLAVVRTYYPQVKCWRYGARNGRGPQLVRYEGQAQPGGEASTGGQPPTEESSVSGAEAGAGEQPQLDPARRDFDEDAPLDEPLHPLISQAELAMLLGTDKDWEEQA